MAINQIRAFQTSDGEVFSNEVDALKHEFKIKISSEFSAIFRDFTLATDTQGDKDADAKAREAIVKYMTSKKVLPLLLQILNSIDTKDVEKFFKIKQKG